MVWMWVRFAKRHCYTGNVFKTDRSVYFLVNDEG